MCGPVGTVGGLSRPHTLPGASISVFVGAYAPVALSKDRDSAAARSARTCGHAARAPGDSLAAAVMNLIAGAGQAFPPRPAPGEPEPLRTVEIRVYTLKDGVRERFHRAVERDVMPLLRQAKIDVIAYGPSAHDEVSYFLIRAFRDLDERAQLEDAFYGSKAWQLGPREAIISAIDHYSTAIVRLSEPTVRSLQSSLTGGNTSAVLEAAAQRASDVAALLARNETYVRAAVIVLMILISATP